MVWTTMAPLRKRPEWQRDIQKALDKHFLVGQGEQMKKLRQAIWKTQEKLIRTAVDEGIVLEKRVDELELQLKGNKSNVVE